MKENLILLGLTLLFIVVTTTVYRLVMGLIRRYQAKSGRKR